MSEFSRQCPRCEKRRLIGVENAQEVHGAGWDKSFKRAVEGAIRMGHTLICEYCKQSYHSETHPQGNLDSTVEIERCQTQL